MTSEAVEAGPARRVSYAMACAALGLLLAGLASDAGGRVLAWPAALLLAGAALRDLVLGPTLRADHEAVRVVTGLRRRTVPWAAVERLRLVTERRTPLLEVDAGDDLLLLSRWRLGRSPSLVLDELAALAPRSLRVSR